MARWELREPHYLYTEPGAKWEYIETDRMTGRQVRKQYDVPAYFHHESEADWNDYILLPNGQKSSGRIVVSDGHNAQPRDIIFKGDPTPGMQPLDDEARAITAKFKDKWNLPEKMFDPNNAGDYGTNLADHFVQMQDKVNMQMSKIEEQRVQGMDKFLTGMNEMMMQNQQILAMLAGKVTDAAEPLNAKPAVEPQLDSRAQEIRRRRVENMRKAREARAAKKKAAA
jgi:hypothetical protein